MRKALKILLLLFCVGLVVTLAIIFLYIPNTNKYYDTFGECVLSQSKTNQFVGIPENSVDAAEKIKTHINRTKNENEQGTLIYKNFNETSIYDYSIEYITNVTYSGNEYIHGWYIVEYDRPSKGIGITYDGYNNILLADALPAQKPLLKRFLMGCISIKTGTGHRFTTLLNT